MLMGSSMEGVLPRSGSESESESESESRSRTHVVCDIHVFQKRGRGTPCFVYMQAKVWRVLGVCLILRFVTDAAWLC
jgi:hypothetical protein